MTGRPIAMRLLAELGYQRREGKRVVEFWLHPEDLIALELELLDDAMFSDGDSTEMRFLGVRVSSDRMKAKRGELFLEWEEP